jgi:hypothetical protein
MYRLTIEIEPDDFAGFHAVILAVIPPDDSVLHVTDSYLTARDAACAARDWIDHNLSWPASA